MKMSVRPAAASRWHHSQNSSPITPADAEVIDALTSLAACSPSSILWRENSTEGWRRERWRCKHQERSRAAEKKISLGALQSEINRTGGLIHELMNDWANNLPSPSSSTHLLLTPSVYLFTSADQRGTREERWWMGRKVIPGSVWTVCVFVCKVMTFLQSDVTLVSPHFFQRPVCGRLIGSLSLTMRLA